MKGFMYIDSEIHEIEFSNFPTSQQRDVGKIGSYNLVYITGWDDFVFKTKTKMKETLKVRPFMVISENGSSFCDRQAFFKSISANISDDNIVDYEYTIGLNAPEFFKNKKETDKNIPVEALNLYKVYLVKKRLEINKKTDIYKI